MLYQDSRAKLASLLSPDELIEPDSPSYTAESTTWASQQNRHPAIVVRPKTVEALSRVLVYLNNTDLELDVRSQGYGNASSKDVLISTSAFDQVHIDEAERVVTLGAGQRWSNYYDKMQEIAPDWTSMPPIHAPPIADIS